MGRLRILALALLVLVATGCTRFLFFPMEPQVLTPDRLGIEFRDETIFATDGTPLHAWFLPAAGKPKATILFLHGNAENISTHIASVWWLPARGYNVLLLDYRGYGESDGVPSLPGLHGDVAGALHSIDTLEGTRDLPVVVFGQSLGGAIAITALAESPDRHKVRALVVEGAFSNYRRLAREKLADSWLTWLFQWPLSYTIDNEYKPEQAIAGISPIPALIIQGQDDTIVPPEHGERLYAAAREPKTFWSLPGVGHIQAMTLPKYRDALVQWLDTVLAAGQAAYPDKPGTQAQTQ